MNDIFRGKLKAYQDTYSTISLRESDLKCVSCNGYSHELLVVPKDQIGLTGGGSYRIIRCLNCIFWGPYYVYFKGEKPLKIVPPKNYQCHEFIKEQCEKDSLASIQWFPGSPAVDSDDSDGLSNRAGGKPAWLQDEEWPSCPLCQRNMQFILQLSSCSIDHSRDIEMRGKFLVSIEYYATLYFFACDPCGVTCSVTQCT